MTDTRVGVGVIGVGRIGALHAQNLAFRIPGATLAAVFDPDREAAEACTKRCGVRLVARDARELIEAPDVAAVVICSPTDLHAEQIEACAAAGKHIFCEKPIDLAISRIDQCLDAVRRAGVKLQIGFNRRFDPGFRRARQAVVDGSSGVPHLVRITSRDPAPPPLGYLQSSGGLFLDMTIHDLDMARWVVGSEVEEISAVGANLVDPEIGLAGDIDTAVLTLRYASGALGTIDNSRRAVYGYDQRLEVFGSRGCVTVGNVVPNTAVLSSATGVTSDPPLHFFIERYEAAFVAEMQDFVDCLREDRAPSVTGADGRIPVLMAMAAERSRKRGQPEKVAIPAPEARSTR